MKKLLYTLILCLFALPSFSQDSLETSKERARKIEGEFRMDILPAFKTVGEEVPGKETAQLKLLGLVSIPYRKGNWIVNGLYNYSFDHSVDLGGACTFELKHGSIGPRLGVIAGKHFGVAPGFIAHATSTNEKLHFFTQNEYIALLGNGYGNSIFSLIEISYHPIHWISFGIEPETKVTFKEKLEVESELTTFIHVHLKYGFVGLGYMFEPPKLGSENIRTISAIRISIGAHF